jgi:hypothetical protein
MAQTFTSTAYSATPRMVETGVFSVSFDYTTPAGTSLSASANSAVVLGPKIQNGLHILGVMGHHSSGAATCPVDIGVDNTISVIASQKTQGSNALAAGGNVPYKVSVSDDAAALYRTLKFGVTPGTDTAVVRLAYTVLLTKDL